MSRGVGIIWQFILFLSFITFKYKEKLFTLFIFKYIGKNGNTNKKKNLFFLFIKLQK